MSKVTKVVKERRVVRVASAIPQIIVNKVASPGDADGRAAGGAGAGGHSSI